MDEAPPMSKVLSQTPNVAVVGLRHGSRHAIALNARIPQEGGVVVCDVDDTRVAQLTQYGSIRSFQSWTDVPRKTDLTIISLPNDLHLQALITFSDMTSGILLCEKPLLRESREADLVPATVRHRIRTICELRLNEHANYIRDIIQNEGISSLHLRWRRNSLPGAQWYMNPQKSGGGAFMDLGIHLLDLLQFLVGEGFSQVSVDSAVLEFERGLCAEVGGTALMTYRGCPIFFDVGWRGGHSGREVEIQLATKNGLHYSFASRTGAHRLLLDHKGVGECSDWYSLFLNDSPLPFARFDESVAVLRLLEALYATATPNVMKLDRRGRV